MAPHEFPSDVEILPQIFNPKPPVINGGGETDRNTNKSARLSTGEEGTCATCAAEAERPRQLLSAAAPQLFGFRDLKMFLRIKAAPRVGGDDGHATENSLGLFFCRPSRSEIT